LQSKNPGELYLSKNVSRVKKRLEPQGLQQQRNLTQMQSRTGEERTMTSGKSSHQVLLEKINYISTSKPTMGEKTTEEDSQGGSVAPSPV